MAGRERDSTNPKKAIDWDCKEDVEAQVKIDGNNLRYAGQRLKDDIDIVLLAGKQNIESLRFATERVRNSNDLKSRLYVSDKKLNNTSFRKQIEKEQFNKEKTEEQIRISKNKEKGIERLLKKESN